MKADQLGQDFDDTSGTNRSGHVDCQAFTRVLIDHRQTLQLLAVGARVDGVACAAPATRQDATAAKPGRRSSGDLAAPERSGCGGNHNADIAPTECSSLPAPARPARPALIRNAAPIGRPTSARTHVAPTGPVLLRNFRDRRLVRLAQDGDHLFFGKPALLHDFLFSVGSHSLKFQLVRKFQGRSALQKFAQRLQGYWHGIVARCRHPLNTSVVEGINNTIKVIKRRAYGYRDEQYFFLKIRAAFPGIPR
ncbi:ISBma1, transposase [Burkholderia pseudomallei]|nr:ISBma1, transposase [Burkholderia pseudomallei]